MKKYLKIIFASLFLNPAVTFATINQPQQPGGVPSDELETLITKISEAILSIIIVIAILFIIIGAFQYVTSAGNPDSVGKAKNTIFYAVIGIIVAILAFSVVKFVVGAF